MAGLEESMMGGCGGDEAGAVPMPREAGAAAPPTAPSNVLIVRFTKGLAESLKSWYMVHRR